jgi:hypothetical protein
MDIPSKRLYKRITPPEASFPSAKLSIDEAIKKLGIHDPGFPQQWHLVFHHVFLLHLDKYPRSRA